MIHFSAVTRSLREIVLLKRPHVLRVTNSDNMGIWQQIAEYLFIKKKDPNRPKSQWIGYMHGINRISILVFILCLLILAYKLLRK